MQVINKRAVVRIQSNQRREMTQFKEQVKAIKEAEMSRQSSQPKPLDPNEARSRDALERRLAVAISR
jgi:hypothetical protein